MKPYLHKCNLDELLLSKEHLFADPYFGIDIDKLPIINESSHEKIKGEDLVNQIMEIAKIDPKDKAYYAMNVAGHELLLTATDLIII